MTRIEFLLNEFVKTEVLTKELLFEMVCADPTSKHIEKDEDEKVLIDKLKVGKYAQWIIKNYLDIPKVDSESGRPLSKETIEESQRVFLEDLYKIKDDLTKYERFKGRLKIGLRDINNLNVETLYDNVKDFSLEEALTTKSERRSGLYHPGADVFYEDDHWLVMEISKVSDISKEAAVFYGGHNSETRWCTSAPGLTYYEGYVKDSPLYVFLDKTDTNLGPKTGLPMHRYQIHFHSEQFMDKDDRRIDFVDFLLKKCDPLLKERFKPMFYNSLVKREHIKISKNDKVISNIGQLYGMKDFFKNISAKVTDLQIMDLDDSLKSTLVINEDLYNLENLKNIIIIDNSIESIDIDFSRFKELSYLCLKDNEKLTSLGCDVRSFRSLKQLDLSGTAIPVMTEFEIVEITPNNYDFELLLEMEKMGMETNVKF